MSDITKNEKMAEAASILGVSEDELRKAFRNKVEQIGSTASKLERALEVNREFRERFEQMNTALSAIEHRLYCRSHPRRDQPGCNECVTVRAFLTPYYQLTDLLANNEKETSNEQ